MTCNSRSALESVEIGHQNARRLTSLWAMMNQLDVSLLAYLTSLLASQETFLPVEKINRKEPLGHQSQHLKQMVLIIDQLETIFRRQRVVDCVEHCLMAKDLLSKPLVDMARTSSCLNTLKGSILRSLQSKKFLQVSQDQFEFVEEDGLLGDTVRVQFPSTRRDVKAAADCFAAECFTGAVFHLMRVAEVGLRCVALDRFIPFADKPLGEKDWGQILKHLEIVVLDLRAAPLTKWRGAQALKELQVMFYSDLTETVRSLDNAWKTHLSHWGPAVFYDRNQSAEILQHVRALMQKLATRLSETAVTEEFWSN